MKTTMSLFILLFSYSLVAAPFTFNAIVDQGPKWEKLGSRKVKYTIDRDEILVTRMEGRFSAIKIKVYKAPIDMMKCVIHYGNGQTQEVQMRNTIRAGGETRVIDIPGSKRVIKKVVFWYDTKNFVGKRAKVELWGRH